MDFITERQANCISVLCTKLNKAEPAGFERMSRRDASECIEELSKMLGGPASFQAANRSRLAPGAGNGALSREAQTRLGLAAKLVHHRWTACGKSPVTATGKSDFKMDVLELFALLGEVEQQLIAQFEGSAWPGQLPRPLDGGGTAGGDAHVQMQEVLQHEVVRD